MRERKDFFISYTGKDAAWAEWIAWVLEDANRSVIVQLWDFEPGSDFVAMMHSALKRADRVLLVLTPAYLESLMAEAEWTAAFSQEPGGAPNRLLPVRVQDCSPDGLLKHRVYVDLVGLSKIQAQERLLAGAKKGRRKPTSEPDFPGDSDKQEPAFPGSAGGAVAPSAIGPDGSFHLPTDELPPPNLILPPGSRMPLKRNRLFVGREEDLLTLAEALNAGETAAIGEVQTAAATGAGGIGKTQLAAEFVYRYGQLFPGGVFWMSFADPEGVEAEVASCGLEPGSPLIDGVTSEAFGAMKLEEQVRRIRLAWKEPVPRLLVFDNCEDPDLLEGWRPEAGGCRVLVTSRRQEWGRGLGIRARLLDKLPRPKSLELLLEHRDDLESDPDLNSLAEELGDFPLAIALAGSYLEVYKGLYPEVGPFLEELRQANPLDHPSMKGAFDGSTVRDHDRHVARTFQVSLERLDPEDPVDSRALSLFARACWFGPGLPIPRWLLRDSLGESSEEEERNRESALHRLVALGLLTIGENESIWIHRLIAYIGRSFGEPAASRVAVEQVVFLHAATMNQAGYPQQLLAWQAQLRTVTDQAVALGSRLASPLCNELGFHLQEAGDFAGARPYYERSLAIAERTLGPEHPDTAHGLSNLGYFLNAIGDPSSARSHQEKALTIRMRILGPEHPLTSISLNNLGHSLHLEGDLLGARQYYERSLKIREKALGPDHPDTASSLNNLGGLLDEQGDQSGARLFYERALAIREKSQGPDHPDTAVSLNNLGMLLARDGDREQALALVARALAIEEKVYGPDHPEPAITRKNLASLTDDEES